MVQMHRINSATTRREKSKNKTRIKIDASSSADRFETCFAKGVEPNKVYVYSPHLQGNRVSHDLLWPTTWTQGFFLPFFFPAVTHISQEDHRFKRDTVRQGHCIWLTSGLVSATTVCVLLADFSHQFPIRWQIGGTCQD